MLEQKPEKLLWDAVTDRSLGFIRHNCPELLLKRLKKIEKGNVLDIGCGSGVFLKSIEPYCAEIIGVDISDEAIHLCRKQFKHSPVQNKFHISDARRFQIKKNHYALISSMSSLTAMRSEETIKILKRIKGGLVPGGIAYLEVLTTRDPLFKDKNKYLLPGETTFYYPSWNSFLHFFRPGELLFRFKEFIILDYCESVVTDHLPYNHIHYEARICCQKPKQA